MSVTLIAIVFAVGVASVVTAGLALALTVWLEMQRRGAKRG